MGWLIYWINIFLSSSQFFKKWLLRLLTPAFFTVLVILSTPFLLKVYSILYGPSGLTNSDFILLVTAGLVLAYTYETQRLKEETIYQRKMSSAVDIKFNLNLRNVSDYKNSVGIFNINAAQHGVSSARFLTPIFMVPLGKYVAYADQSSGEGGYCYFDSESEIKEFLHSIQKQDCKIKLSVKTTDGENFIYTYKVVGGAWKRLLEQGNLTPDIGSDDFILVCKELDEY